MLVSILLFIRLWLLMFHKIAHFIEKETSIQQKPNMVNTSWKKESAFIHCWNMWVVFYGCVCECLSVSLSVVFILLLWLSIDVSPSLAHCDDHIKASKCDKIQFQKLSLISSDKPRIFSSRCTSHLLAVQYFMARKMNIKLTACQLIGVRKNPHWISCCMKTQFIVHNGIRTQHEIKCIGLRLWEKRKMMWRARERERFHCYPTLYLGISHEYEWVKK